MFVVKLCFLVFLLDGTLSGGIDAAGVFRFANIYGDHMVLQMKPFSAMLWGFGEIGQKVDVCLGSEVQTTEVVQG